MEKLTFRKLFSKKELQEIKGVRNKNFFILILIISGTFLAINIADGGLDYLRLRMNDPFVQNLDIKIPYDKAYNIENYRFNLNQDSISEKFQYDTVLSFVNISLLFRDYNRNDFFRTSGRSIDYKNPLLEQILSKNNLVAGRGFKDEFDIGLIVTDRMLEKLHYAKDDLFVDMALPRIDDGLFSVPIPVIAVVKELPGLSDFVYTPYFYKLRNTSFDNPFSLDQYSDISFYMSGQEEMEIQEVRESLMSFMEGNGDFKDRDPYIDHFKITDTREAGVLFKITFYPEPVDEIETERLYNLLLQADDFKNLDVDLIRYYDYNMNSYPDYDIFYDKLSVIFKSLKKVRAFKEFMYNEYELEVEMEKVRDKENFTAVSILTISVAIMLLVFSVFSVTVFISNLLKSHLNKIKMNLGTLKAFGMSNREIKAIYKTVIRKFCLLGIIVSMGIVFFIDIVFILLIFKELSAFQFFNFFMLLSIISILVSVEWTVKKTAMRLLENTPGDLIYQRDQE